MMTNLEVKLAAYGVLLDILMRQIAQSNPEVIRGVIWSGMSVKDHKPPKDASESVIQDGKRINEALLEAVTKLRKDTGL